jgi:hypothetical protein
MPSTALSHYVICAHGVQGVPFKTQPLLLYSDHPQKGETNANIELLQPNHVAAVNALF